MTRRNIVLVVLLVSGWCFSIAVFAQEHKPGSLIVRPDGSVEQAAISALIGSGLQVQTNSTGITPQQDESTVTIDFNDLGGGELVAFDRYIAVGVQISTGPNGTGGSVRGSSILGPCNGTRSIQREPFTGPSFLFRFPQGASQVSLDAGDFGPSDSDAITLKAFGDDALASVVATDNKSIPQGAPTGCVRLSVSANVIKAVEVTSVSFFNSSSFPNSVFVDNLVFAKVCAIPPNGGNTTNVPAGPTCPPEGFKGGLGDTAGNKVDLFCEGGEFHLKHNGRNVGRCPWFGGRNEAQITHVGTGGWNSEVECFIRTFWRSVEPRTEQGEVSLQDWKTFNFDVKSGTLVLKHFASADGPGGSSGDRLIKQAVNIDPVNFNPPRAQGDEPMVTVVFEPCDNDRDGDCDANDFVLVTRAIGQCEGDDSYNELADADHDGCVTTTDQQQLFSVIPVHVDAKPGSCPNAFNPDSKGVLPVAVLGTAVHDVTLIDAGSIRLAGVPPIRSSIEDVSTPPDNSEECTTEGADGFDDLILKFDSEAIAAALGLVRHGDEVVLTLTGNLINGTPFEGTDVLAIVGGKTQSLIRTQRVASERYALFQNLPNPFRAKTKIFFQLRERAHVIVRVLDVFGQEIRVLVDTQLKAGHHTIVWDGKNRKGRQVSNGIYQYEFRAGGFSAMRRMRLVD